VNVNTTVVRNTYVDRTVINNTTVNNRLSFNGAGGTRAQPNAQEQAALHENHVQPTTAQLSHNQTASHDRNQFASVNKGHPVTTAMDKPGGNRFSQQGKNAPAPVSRPATGIKAANNNASVAGNHPANGGNNHPASTANNPARTNNGAGNNQHQARAANQPPHQNNNKPAQARPKQQAPKNNPHPPHPQHVGGEGDHHKER
jgi:hypothetical protein